jgi:lysine 6-dehydrogenase
MGKNYAIIGSGHQGTASAYDLARFSEADQIILADSNLEQAEAAAKRINPLTEGQVAIAVQLDAENMAKAIEFLERFDVDAFVSGTPHGLNLGLTQVAIETQTGMTDLGGNSEVVHAQLALNDKAAQAEISIVPDCSLGPGMTTSLALYVMGQLDVPQDVIV